LRFSLEILYVYPNHIKLHVKNRFRKYQGIGYL
jgi:hypothetical protein